MTELFLHIFAPGAVDPRLGNHMLVAAFSVIATPLSYIIMRLLGMRPSRALLVICAWFAILYLAWVYLPNRIPDQPVGTKRTSEG